MLKIKNKKNEEQAETVSCLAEQPAAPDVQADSTNEPIHTQIAVHGQPEITDALAGPILAQSIGVRQAQPNPHTPREQGATVTPKLRRNASESEMPPYPPAELFASLTEIDRRHSVHDTKEIPETAGSNAEKSMPDYRPARTCAGKPVPKIVRKPKERLVTSKDVFVPKETRTRVEMPVPSSSERNLALAELYGALLAHRYELDWEHIDHLFRILGYRPI